MILLAIFYNLWYYNGVRKVGVKMIKVNGYSMDNPKRLPKNIDCKYLDELYVAMIKNNLEINSVFKVEDNGSKNGLYVTFANYDPDFNDDGTRFIFSNFGYFPNK